MGARLEAILRTQCKRRVVKIFNFAGSRHVGGRESHRYSGRNVVVEAAAKVTCDADIVVALASALFEAKSRDPRSKEHEGLKASRRQVPLEVAVKGKNAGLEVRIKVVGIDAVSAKPIPVSKSGSSG